MATSNDEPPIDPREFPQRHGDDTTPIMALVRDQPYGRGGITSESRTASPAYMAFLKRARESNGRDAG